MPEVGVRELKISASEIVRAVRERRARYLITYRGRPVGVLLPLDDASPTDRSLAAAQTSSPWQELTTLGQQIGKGWTSQQTSTELLSDMRR
jgi:prevent-host-death family protein